MTFVVQVEKAEWIVEQDRDLLRAARTIPILLEPGFVERAIRPGSISHEEDQNNIERLSRMADALDLAYLYTLIDLDGTIYITSSSASEEERQSATEVRAFTLYSEMEEEVRATLASGTPHFRTYTDRWGTFRHVYIPLKNSRGIPYVLAADQGEGMLTAQLVPLLIKNALLPLFFVLIAIPFFIIYRKQLDKHAQHLQRLNRKVSATKERLEMATEASGIGVWEWNVQTGETIFNERWAEIIGYTIEELAPVSIETWTQFCHPDDQEESTRLLQECFTGERTYYNYETRMRHKNGDWIWVLDRGKIGSWTDDGQPRWMYGTHQDITERKRTEQAVVAERDLSRQYLDVAGVLMVALDNTQTVTMINPRGCDVLGAPREEILGKNWIDTFLPPEQIEEVKAVFNQLMTGELAPVEYHDNCIVRADGSQRIISWHNAIMKDAEGNITGLLSSGDDITERKKAREALQRSEATLRKAQEIAHLGSWELDLATERFTLSDEAYHMYGQEPREEGLSRADFMEWVHPDDRAYGKKLFEALLAEGEATFEYRVIRPGGEVRWITGRGITSFDQAGNPLKMFGIQQDITERKRIENRLRENEEQLQLMFKQAPLPLCMNAFDGTYLSANAAYEKLIGYTADELLGMTFFDITHPDDRPKNNDHLKDMSTDQAAGFEMEKRYLCKDGSQIIVMVHATTIHDAEGEPLFGLAVVEDITELKRAKQALLESHEQLETRVQARTTELQTRKEEAETLNRAMINLLQDLKETNLGLETTREALHATNNELEAFSYSVSHDLRAPLRHIDGFIKLLLKREKENLDETSARYLETIAQSSGRMGQLIDDLLAFARTGRAELHPKPVAPNELIQEITEELSSLSEERHLTWMIDDLPAVQADRNLLRQVWQNLIGNAVKYTEPCANARIEIGTTHSPNKEESDEIIFFIRDNGVGFDPQYKHKLFGVFQRLHRNDEFEGTGIGLATVRRIVHRHGGRVWAEGKIDGGATFFFTLKQAKGTK
jgi:PAS domain S-box-containing protein